MAKHAFQQPQKTEGEKSDLIQVTVILGTTPETTWTLSELAEWFRPDCTELKLVHAIPSVTDFNWFGRDAQTYAETIVRSQREIQETGEVAIETLKNQGFSATLHSTGVLSDEGCHHLLDDLKEEGTNLLVAAIPNSKQQHAVSGFFGCLTLHAHCPVLLLKRPLGSHKDRLKILIATDGEEASLNAGRRLSELLPTERMYATIATVQSPVYLENAVTAPYINVDGMQEALHENALLKLDITKAILQESGVSIADCEILTGNPAWELLQFAQILQPDLIVTGSHNRSNFAAWLLGSVSQRLAQSSDFNMLIVR
jgi:nucleotide-binding universal stress UspA family protein